MPTDIEGGLLAASTRTPALAEVLPECARIVLNGDEGFRRGVVDVGAAPMPPPSDVVGLTPMRRLGASGNDAPAIASDQGPDLRR